LILVFQIFSAFRQQKEDREIENQFSDKIKILEGLNKVRTPRN
jgi:hypothetical protein